MLFYTFCVDIGRHSKTDLCKILIILLKSLHKYIENYKLLCFTNFEIVNIDEKYNIEFRNYYDNAKTKIYNDKWLNLSFNKINIYKDLYDEFNKDFTWIDLDTIIAFDISYIDNFSNIFIENGGNCINKNVLFSNNNTITVPRNKYIQGNFWKLNIGLYNELIKTYEELNKVNLILRYDLQDLFSYHIYIKKGNLNCINILGNNVRKESINGLCIWSKLANTHATVEGLNNLYIDKNIIKSKFYPDKEIHIISFTFHTLLKLYNENKFNKLFNP